jgi:hypothetical protein
MRAVAKRSKVRKHPIESRRVISSPFALTLDGQLLINTAECEGRSLEGRPMFTGALVSPDEAQITRSYAGDAIAGAASKIAANMPVVEERSSAPKRETTTASAAKPARSSTPRRARGKQAGEG